MAVIVLQPRAKADLAEIWEFIAEDSDEQADAFIDLIDQKFQLLAQQSGIGRRRDELAYGLRSFLVWDVTSSSISPFPAGGSDRAGAAWGSRPCGRFRRAGSRMNDRLPLW